MLTLYAKANFPTQIYDRSKFFILDFYILDFYIYYSPLRKSVLQYWVSQRAVAHSRE